MVTFTRILNAAMSCLRPPSSVRNMMLLDRARFTNEVELPILKVRANSVSSAVKFAKKYFLKLENFKPVQNAPSVDDGICYKHIYLDPDKVSQWLDFEESERVKLVESSVEESSFAKLKVLLTYENWRSDQIFKAVLPEDAEIVSGYSLVGHILHLNLRDHLLPYRSLIGQVLLDKVKICRTVVNKSNIIDNTYRNFAMEVIAGEENFNVTVKENNCTFQFDFSKVYWNPRLGKEHERIIKLLNENDVLFDVFCGVGPFAVPALRKKCRVFANDLNPESFKWLNHNAKLNCRKNIEYFKSYNIDGKEFIKEHFKNFVVNALSGSDGVMEDGAKIHVTMNLPAMAVEFLDTFNGLLKDVNIPSNKNLETIVHVYCFTYGDTPEITAKEMVNKYLGVDLAEANIIEVFHVRNVAPSKEMMRVSFRLTNSILKRDDTSATEEAEPPLKKFCS